MRVALAGLFHESNTFNPLLTQYEDYQTTRLLRGEEIPAVMADTDSEVAGFLTGSFESVPVSVAWTWPLGPLTRDCFERVLGDLLDGLRARGPYDGVLLSLHGAMVAEGVPDADAQILAAVREVIGGIPLIATFDLHANLHPRMAALADALIGYRTYPHVDLRARGVEAARLMERTLSGAVRPVCAIAKPPLMPHIMTMLTASGPAAEVLAVADQERAERALLSTSVAFGFAYADLPHLGLATVAVANGSRAAAQEAADAIAAAAWERRPRFWLDLPTPAEAVAQALAAPSGPVVLADIGDNVGGGTPGDGTFLLQELIAQRAREAVLLLADPQAVEACVRAGVGRSLDLPVGGRRDTLHGAPVALTGRVKALTDGVFRNRGPMRDGLVDDQGTTAVLACDIGHLVLTSRRMPSWNLEQLRAVGLEPTRQRILVCKGALAHRAAYQPIATAMIDVDTPGVTPADYRRFTYQHARRPLWRLDEQATWPLPGGAA
ncbi:MAG: M81 family metallopeptidase [Fimbriimonadaceae bacterium]|nr:M81 family metallopeptidase [Fimbriimonadaceae bacterium]